MSGPNAQQIAIAILGVLPKIRYAEYHLFKDHNAAIIDEGIALFFSGPNSFTGEDVLELHGHGGPVVMDRLLQAILKAGARLAKPGEFSERAFLNNKIDLAQAESIADLINASSQEAARCAVRSLQGEFSRRIHNIVDQLIELRKWVEACIDFPEEEIDFLKDERVQEALQKIILDVSQVLSSAKQGALLQEGMTVVIAGKPNVGKSSLLNQLSGKDSAIVTHIAGTTRDILREYINIDGMPLHIVDTAGLRNSDDPIEQEGMRRAQQEISNADALILMTDATEEGKPEIPEIPEISTHIRNIPIILVKNKIDITNECAEKINANEQTVIKLSAKTGVGIDLLKNYLKELMGYHKTDENNFIARRRHVNALENAKSALENGLSQLRDANAGELLAEELRLAQNSLSQITGEFTSDDLLGEIFSSFCIGK